MSSSPDLGEHAASELQAFASQFIASTRDYVFIRPEDHLLILRPNRVHHLNATATAMLHALYIQEPVDVAALVSQTAARYRVPEPQVVRDLDSLMRPSDPAFAEFIAAEREKYDK